MRIQATKNKDEFGKAFYKLMNNSCFGQLIMNERRFKTGKFVYANTKVEKRGIEVSELRVATSNPKLVYYYDLDDENSFVLFNECKTLPRPIDCVIAIFGFQKHT